MMKTVFAAASVLGLVTSAYGAQPHWLDREFSKGWNLPGHSVEEFLNDECHTSGLDGIQMFAIQNGHGSTYNLHVYCRQDGATKSRYKVTLSVFPKAKFGSVVQEALAKPNVRIGPFHFGDEGEGDGLLLVERLR